ncbi:hypothetical protein [Pseudoalteromonas sp. L21]|uniref:hypothetical protein n=1 Tax=Pseudoalteromonas sp. L21 TaxID=1539746 RepID=UPI001F300F2F|nr:hypothetical protein [Pseudoalteromonas sp. L21]MCF7519384.1 hypothetical protein [Pseudoalteromonas sp. L21]
MSLSRKLVETLVQDEVNKNAENYQDLNKEKLIELANQAFLIQVTQFDASSVKKSLQDKIEHFNAIMSDS